MRANVARPPNEKRRSWQGPARNFSNGIDNNHHNAGEDQTQRAARHLSRRYALRLSLAAVIAAECGMGDRA